MGRPQPKPQPEPKQPGLKVVEKPSGAQEAAPGEDKTDGQEEATAKHNRETETAMRRRLHPPRVWPD